jgi:hypothetical protein
MLRLLKDFTNLMLEAFDLFNQSSCMIYLSVGGIFSLNMQHEEYE